jgi:phage-related minor tail protein
MADDTTSGGTFRIEADLSPITDALRTLEILSQSFGSQLTGALKSAVIHGRDLDDVLRSIGSNLSGMALNRGLRPLQILTNGLFDDLFSGLGPLMPFAKGGVVSSPGYFPTAGGLGVAGEAGPEAILPLRRGADGRLGVATAGGGAPVSVVFNVTTPDAASFAKSEAQITGMLARAVARGARTL